MNNQKPIYDMHAENNAWLGRLSFYKGELNIMQGRIDEIAFKNTSNDVLSMIDHFQNQVIIQRTQISIIKHLIKRDVAQLETSVEKNPVAADHQRTDDHEEHREQMKRFEEIFSEMRREFMAFLSRTM